MYVFDQPEPIMLSVSPIILYPKFSKFSDMHVSAALHAEAI